MTVDQDNQEYSHRNDLEKMSPMSRPFLVCTIEFQIVSRLLILLELCDDPHMLFVNLKDNFPNQSRSLSQS